MVGDVVRLVLDDYKSNFISYELPPAFRNFSEVLLGNLHFEYDGVDQTVDIEYDDISMKTELVARPGIIAIKFDERLFFRCILGLIPCWDYKHYNEYISQELISIGKIDKVRQNGVAIDGSIVNGTTQLILYSSLVLHKLPVIGFFSSTGSKTLRKKICFQCCIFLSRT